MRNAELILSFYQTLNAPEKLPENIVTMNPYAQATSWQLVKTFYTKYYNDNVRRIALFGINPGRLGGGITGIPFTDPIRLQEICGIENSFDKKMELSSSFIYEMIQAHGGPKLFYNNYFLTAISPLGFTYEGKNINYYDIPDWKSIFEESVIQYISQQLNFINTDLAVCIGQGENYKFLNELNDRYQFFKEIRTVPHPRWIMQYRLKRKQEFIDVYKERMIP